MSHHLRPSREAERDTTAAADGAEGRALAHLATVATALDATEESLVIAASTLATAESPADWPIRSNASWWLAAARFEEDERDAVRFLSSALGRWDDQGELYMRATPDDVAQALTEWYLAREEAA